MTPSLIALLTDFGERDPYAGIMKGVILSRCPDVRIVDLCHGVPPQDVRAAGFLLAASEPYFPVGTLFVCVVDPGVGSGRAILWARGKGREFLVPDNGLLSFVEREERLREVRRVTDDRVFLREVSRTFHGRDIFAPVAAARAMGRDPEGLGPRVRGFKRLPLPIVRRRGGTLRGEVVYIDRFGNAVTSLRPADVPKGARLRAAGIDFGPPRKSYSAVPPGRPLAVPGSFGLVELSIREGDAARSCGLSVGEEVHAG